MTVRDKLDEYNNNTQKLLLHQTILRESAMAPMTTQGPLNPRIIITTISIITSREDTIAMRSMLQLHPSFCLILSKVAILIFLFVICLHYLLTPLMVVIMTITPGV